MGEDYEILRSEIHEDYDSDDKEDITRKTRFIYRANIYCKDFEAAKRIREKIEALM